MGLKATRQAWACEDVKGTDKLILLALADFADETTLQCWPSMATLAKMCGVKPRQAQRSIAKLEEKNIITVERNVGRSHTNTYTLKGVTQDTNTTQEKVSPMTPIKKEKVSPVVEKVSPVVIKGVTHDTRSIKNHKDPSSMAPKGDRDGKWVLLLIDDLGFVYRDSDAKQKAIVLEEKYTDAQLTDAAMKTKAEHDKKVRAGGRGITSPLSYMSSILSSAGVMSNGNVTPDLKAVQTITFGAKPW